MANTNEKRSGDAVATYDPTTGVLHVEHPAIAPSSLLLRSIADRSGEYLAVLKPGDAPREVTVRASIDAMRDIVTAAAMTLGAELGIEEDAAQPRPGSNIATAIADEVERRLHALVPDLVLSLAKAIGEAASEAGKPTDARLAELSAKLDALRATP